MRGLRLDPLSARDAASFCSLYGNADTMRFIGAPLSRRAATAAFRATLQASRAVDGPRFFAVRTQRTRPAVGLCVVQTVAARRAEIGLMLTSGVRRRGIGRACVRALAGWAFRTLPIDALWVQYRPANVAAHRLFAGLGFVPFDGARPRAARTLYRLGLMQRSAWLAKTTHPSPGGNMSSITSFLENVGRDAALRHASTGQLRAIMQREHMALAWQDAIVDRDAARIASIGGVTGKIYCATFPVKVPQKAPAKKPGKKPEKPSKPTAPAKKPSKAPAKKTPKKK